MMRRTNNLVKFYKMSSTRYRANKPTTFCAWESKVAELLIAPISLSEHNKRISN